MSGDLIIGGKEHPIVYDLNEDLILNGGFESDLTSWTSSGSTITRVAVDEAPRGRYVMDIEGMIPGMYNYAYCYLDVEPQTYYLTRFFSRAVVVGQTLMTIRLSNRVGGAEVNQRDCYIEDEYRELCLVSEIPAGMTMAELQIHACWNDSVDNEGQIRIDNVEFRKITQGYDLPQADDSKTEFERIESMQEMADGSLKSYLKGYRPRIALKWNYLETDDQSAIENIFQFESCYLFPHSDVGIGYMVRIPESIQRNWVQGFPAGHENELLFEGTELLPSWVPVAAAATIGWSVPDQSFFRYGSEGGSFPERFRDSYVPSGIAGFSVFTNYEDVATYSKLVARELMRELLNLFDVGTLGRHVAPVIVANIDVIDPYIPYVDVNLILPIVVAGTQLQGAGIASGSNLTDPEKDWTNWGDSLVGHYLTSFSGKDDGKLLEILSVSAGDPTGTKFTVDGTPKTGRYFVISRENV